VDAHLRQSVISLPQCPTQRRERPGRSAVPLAIGLAARLGQDAFPLGPGVDDRGAAAVARLDGGYPPAVEARDEMGDRVPAAPARGFGRVGVAVPIGDGEQGFGAGHVGGGFGP